jgi:hypothetical protein
MSHKKPTAQQRKTTNPPSDQPNKGPQRALRLSRATEIKKTGPVPGAAAEPTSSVLIVLGYDEEAKPRAARFVDADPDLVGKAAEAMNLDVRPGSSPEVAKAAARLPVGRLYANGTGFVPVIRQALYTEIIVAMAGDYRVQRDNVYLPIGIQGPAPSWNEIASGHLVLAQESLEYGWWEAVVVGRTGDQFILRYRDFPTLPTFVRPRTAIGLISPPAE